ncbi:hypothetical protein ACH4E7_40800 [Kitasatospora sp. NPDC018058]|uniref:hypothetical protein n=1 Tax=Kitasatospora sp. NPDC018058 TaxID=3364025 RepID=UPI0037C0AED0
MTWPSLFLLDPAQYPQRRRTPARRPVRPGRLLPLLIAGTPCPACGGRLLVTQPQAQLLTLTAHGHTPRAIGGHLRSTTTQVEGDLQALTAELGAANPVHAIDIAYRAGLLRRSARFRRLDRPPTDSALAALQGMAAGLSDSEIGQQTGRTARAVDEALRRFTRMHSLHTRPQTVSLLHCVRLLDDTHPCPCQSDPEATTS